MQSSPISVNRLQIVIVVSLKKLNATSPISAITIHELRSYCPTDHSYHTFYRAIKYLLQNGYVFLGAKDGKNDTYYLNEKGNALIKECC